MIRRFLLTIFTVFTLCLVAQSAQAASLGISPSSVTMREGETKSFSLTVNSADQAMNASQGKFSFPVDKLQVTNVAKGSLFKYWTDEPAYSNSNGTVTFGGGLPTPGFTGSGRAVLTVMFRAKATGTATLTYSSGTILANDGDGTNILTGYGSATVRISEATSTNTAPSPTPTTPASPSTPAPSVGSSTHPDQNTWYAKTDVQLTWTRPAGLQGVSYIFDQNGRTTPDDAVENSNGSVQLVQTADGVWYFHLRAKYAAGWSPTVHYRVQIDTQPPTSFTPQVIQEGGARNPTAVISFQTSDSGSGHVAYSLSLDDGAFAPATSPATVKQTRAGLHQFTVRATDQAGNYRDAIGEFTVEGSSAPRLTSVPKTLALFAELTVEGLAVQGDTLVLSIDGREIGRFLADDAHLTPAPGVGIPDGLVLWRFQATPFLAPGFHELSAYAVNQYGIQSPASVPASFQTLGSTFSIFGVLIPTYLVIFTLLVIIFVLLGLLILVYERYRHWRRAESFDLARAESEIDDEIGKLQTSLEKDIVGAIRTAVTERSMQAATHEEIRRDIAQMRQRIDDLIEKQVKQQKKKRKK
ncbi:MAG: cohesin domain-containing protein [bacterium]|nr:cohesin domain-containing protein [bacterium]